MSDVAAAVSGQRDGSVPPPKNYRLLRHVRRFGYGLLAVQFAGFLAWSAVLYFHFSVTADYATYNQPMFLVAHGNFNPFGTVLHAFGTVSRTQFWRNDGELMPWVLAPVYWVFRSGLVLPWMQDLSIVGAELVAFTWLCDVARRRCMEREAAWLSSLGLLLLVANPWLWWTVSFDVHEETLVIFFTAFMAWDLSRGKRRAWVWAVPVLLGGAPTATYVLGVGLGGVLAGRRTRHLGAVLAVMGVAYSLLLAAVHGNGAANVAIHVYLKEASGDPFRVLAALWNLRADIIANTAASGLLGIGVPLITPLALGVVVPDTLSGTAFAEPLFQNVPLYVLLPVGTIMVLVWLLQRYRRVTFALAGVLAVQAVGWAAVWGPHTPGQWLRITGSEAATLASLQARIPASAEVIASQGVIGRFSARTLAYPIFGEGYAIPLTQGTWLIITPTTGIETVTATTSMALIGELAGPLHSQLVAHANGVWAFHQVTLPPGISSVYIPSGSPPLPAWAGAGPAGQPVLDGQESNWHMAATGARGYVADGIQWQESPGRYRAAVTLSVSAAPSAPVNVEVWDDTAKTIVARRSITHTAGMQQIELPLTVPPGPGDSAYSGWGPFHADFVNPPPGHRIEVRVWSPGGAAVNVYSADLTTATDASVPET